VSVERDAQDDNVATEFTVERGSTHCRIRFHGGVQVSVPRPELRIGDPSDELKVVDVSLKSQTLILTAYLKQAGGALFTVRSRWKLTGATGADVESHKGDLYTMLLQMPPGGGGPAQGAYVKGRAELRFANR
jgi:hypothetical protein